MSQRPNGYTKEGFPIGLHCDECGVVLTETVCVVRDYIEIQRTPGGIVERELVGTNLFFCKQHEREARCLGISKPWMAGMYGGYDA